MYDTPFFIHKILLVSILLPTVSIYPNLKNITKSILVITYSYRMKVENKLYSISAYIYFRLQFIWVKRNNGHEIIKFRNKSYAFFFCFYFTRMRNFHVSADFRLLLLPEISSPLLTTQTLKSWKLIWLKILLPYSLLCCNNK